ncbi:hypothetical protein FJZ21_01795 [Candidatus Pacearchaeota archaeon]|nr:hypothetical protein [Candidatus Pacearchaeota archaeon]
MKFIFFGIVFFLLTFVSAQENLTSNLTGPGFLDTIKDSSSKTLAKPIILPPWLEVLNEVIFNLEDISKGIPFGKIFLLTLLWVVLFIFSLNILNFTAFERKWVRVVIGLSVTFMISTTGALNNFIEMLFGVTGFFLSWKGLLLLVGLFVAYFILSAFLKEFARHKKLSALESKGIKAGIAIDNLARTTDIVSKSS